MTIAGVQQRAKLGLAGTALGAPCLRRPPGSPWASLQLLPPPDAHPCGRAAPALAAAPGPASFDAAFLRLLLARGDCLSTAPGPPAAPACGWLAPHAGPLLGPRKQNAYAECLSSSSCSSEVHLIKAGVHRSFNNQGIASEVTAQGRVLGPGPGPIYFSFKIPANPISDKGW